MSPSAGLPVHLWAEAVNSTVYILNYLINTQTRDIMPYKIWFKTKPTVQHYRVYGSIAYIYINKTFCTKYQAKGQRVVFVGDCSTSKGFCFWKPGSKKVIESFDVIFDELTMFSPKSFSGDHSDIEVPSSLFEEFSNTAILPIQNTAEVVDTSTSGSSSNNTSTTTNLGTDFSKPPIFNNSSENICVEDSTSLDLVLVEAPFIHRPITKSLSRQQQCQVSAPPDQLGEN